MIVEKEKEKRKKSRRRKREKRISRTAFLESMRTATAVLAA
jgi:hypothetical protein